MPERVDLEVLRRLARVIARVNAGQRLEETLQAVADGVVEALGFGCAAVNYRQTSGEYCVMAVNGPPDARASLVGSRIAGDTMEGLLDGAEAWGELRYIGDPGPLAGHPAVWTPSVGSLPRADAWTADDMLLAPLCGPDGALVGVLSVDLPPEQVRPGRVLCELLEMFALLAGVAILNAQLAEELRLEHERLRASEVAFRFAFSGSPGAMAALFLEPERRGRFARVNEAMARVLGYSVEALAERNWLDLIADRWRPDSQAALADFAAGRRHNHRVERQMIRRDGNLIWASLIATVIYPAGDQTPFLLLHLEDITERKTREDTLARHAHLDPLTGLANRRVVFKYLDSLVADATHLGSPGVVLYCDLDGFKAINDNYGHATGDLVLQEAAERLSAQVRSADVVARLGGDEFVVVAVDLDDDAAEQLVDRVQAAFRAPLATVPEVVDISVGMVRITGSSDVAALLDNADQAMYAQKYRARLFPQAADPP